MEVPKTKRHVAFVERAIAGEALGEAWGASARDMGKEPGTRAANNVAGSRMAARFADFIAARKAEIAKARAADAATPITRETLANLMEETTQALLTAADAASRAGAEGIALSLRKTITVHAGRTARTIRRAPAPEKSTPDLPLDDMLTRLECGCD